MKAGEIDSHTALRLVDPLPSKAERSAVVERGAEEIQRTAKALAARRDWLRRAESWREHASAGY